MCDLEQLYVLDYLSARLVSLVACVREFAGSIPGSSYSSTNCQLLVKGLALGYRYHKLRRAFSKLYRRHRELVSRNQNRPQWRSETIIIRLLGVILLSH